jgi:peptidoglycan hydrolase CwlO-like protein
MDKNKKSRIATIILASVIVIIVVFAGVSIYNNKTSEIDSLQTENVNISQELQERDSLVNEMVTAFNDIEDNLKFIKEKREMLSIENQKEGGRDQKQAIIEDIKLMNEMLEKSSAHIDDLEKKLKRSGIEMSSFKKKIASLNQNIEDQNTQIASLQKQVEERDMMLATLNQKVDTMSFEIAKKVDTLQLRQQEIEEKTYQLNKGYVAYGTYKELADNGVLTKDGGFLGIGKHVALEENFDNQYFTELNIQDTKTIPLFTNKAKIISEHPDSSYTFVEEDGVIAYLEIEDPAEFWKISKYAVIEIK